MKNEYCTCCMYKYEKENKKGFAHSEIYRYVYVTEYVLLYSRYNYLVFFLPESYYFFLLRQPDIPLRINKVPFYFIIISFNHLLIKDLVGNQSCVRLMKIQSDGTMSSLTNPKAVTHCLSTRASDHPPGSWCVSQ